MFSSEEHSDLFKDDLKVMTNCPLCGYYYNPVKAQILEENEEAHLIHITCNKCKASVVAVVLDTAMGLSSIGLVTDLDPEDVLKFKNMPVLSADEVLDIHEEIIKCENIKELINK